MKKDEKTKIIDSLAERLTSSPNFYLADISTLTAEKTTQLRKLCFDKGVQLLLVKNSLLRKALEKNTSRDYKPLIDTVVGSTSIMFSESGSAPAKVIKEFRKGSDRPLLKSAFIEESVYIGDKEVDALAAIKSKNELIGDIVGLLQSPAKNVLGALLSGKHKLAGVVKALENRKQ